jgi:hypothetical protein
MPFKAFKRIYGTSKLKRKPENDLKIKDAGGNDLGYKGSGSYSNFRKKNYARPSHP